MKTPQGFRFAVAACGFKKSDCLDLALVMSDFPCKSAGVFTTNRFQAAPVLVAKEHLEFFGTSVRALVANSGQANACTGAEGLRRCRKSLELLQGCGLEPREVLPASTGVIGDQLKLSHWEKAMPELARSLGHASLVDAAKAIMTTDSFPKMANQELSLSGGTVRLAGFCKGAGMISPNMATMLGFLLCDGAVDQAWWQQALSRCVQKSFNAITVDGDTSTNDCVLALSNGAACVVAEEEYAQLEAALLAVCQDLAYKIVQDAEGGTKVMRVRVHEARDNKEAEFAARAVGNSPLVKTALYGCDPNWGRIVAALGRSGAEFRADDVRVALGGEVLFAAGMPVAEDWDSVLAAVLRRDQVDIDIWLGQGVGESTLLASDLTEEYIRINAEYRT